MATCTILVINNAPGCANPIAQQFTGNCDTYIVRLSSNSNALGPFDVYLNGVLIESNLSRTEMFNGVVVTCGCTPTPTLTPTPTPTPSTSQTPTPTPTQTSTPTQTPTIGVSQTPTPSVTTTQTPTPSVTTTETPTNTPTPTQTPTNTQTQTPSETPTNTPTPSPTTTPGLTPTQTPTETPTQTQTPTETPTQTPTTTETPTETPTNTPTETPTNTPTETPTQTQTPTETPTQTPTPSISYWLYSLGYDATLANTACVNFTLSPINVYGSPSEGPGPNIGETLYSDSALTTTVPDGYYSNGIAWYQVTGGAGLITSQDPNGCSVSPTPTNTSTPTQTPTPTPTMVDFEILLVTQDGVELLAQDGSSLSLQQEVSAFNVSSGDTSCPSSTTLTQTIYADVNNWSSVVRFFSNVALTIPFNGGGLNYTNNTSCGDCWIIDSDGYTSNFNNPC